MGSEARPKFFVGSRISGVARTPSGERPMVEQRPVTVKNGGDRRLSPRRGNWFNWGQNATPEEKDELARALVQEVYKNEPSPEAVNAVRVQLVEHFGDPGWQTTEEDIRAFAGEG